MTHRLYLHESSGSEIHTSTSWRNLCRHTQQLKLMRTHYPNENPYTWGAAWHKLRDQELESWHAVLHKHPDLLDCYLEFADSESLTAFVLAWS